MQPLGSGSVDYGVIAGPDISLKVSMSDIRDAAGNDYDPPGGDDLGVVSRGRLTDHNNCAPNPCNSPGGTPATTRDFDFLGIGAPQGVPITCIPNGAANAPPGSDCNLNTTYNSLFPGSFVANQEMSYALFRVRILDQQNKLVAQQGLFIP
jgi:hypothetical protein